MSDYVVLKHKLNDMNGSLLGVQFRGGYAVVIRGSKLYTQLKQLPLLRGQPEFELPHLRNVKFITRSLDINSIFGPQVYNAYMAQIQPTLEKEQIQKEEKKIEIHTEAKGLCSSGTVLGEMCRFPALANSPSGYCRKHILTDPKLEALGIHVPKLTKQERDEYKDKVLAQLDKLAKKR